MSLRPLAFVAALALAAPAAAQPVEVAPLAAPDLFATPARDTGLSADLWRGASPDLMRFVLPLLATKPLSPAAAALGRRVLATGAAAPAGAGQDAALAAARARALAALGDAAGAAALMGRAPAVERSPELAQAAAEAALLNGDDDRACRIAEGLGEGRGDIYWMRLRAYCQAVAGEEAAAQLTFELAQSQSRDATYGRLMTALIAGGAPGPAAMRNGLDASLSRRLGLAGDPAAGADATQGVRLPAPVDGPTQGVAVAIAAGDLDAAKAARAALAADGATPVEPADLAVLDAMLAAAEGRQDGPTLDRLVERAGTGADKARARARDAALLFAALGSPLADRARFEFARLTPSPGKASPARLAALEAAADAGRAGEAALLALWASADAGEAGLATADRARVVRALAKAGLPSDAQAYALEGLMALR